MNKKHRRTQSLCDMVTSNGRLIDSRREREYDHSSSDEVWQTSEQDILQYLTLKKDGKEVELPSDLSSADDDWLGAEEEWLASNP